MAGTKLHMATRQTGKDEGEHTGLNTQGREFNMDQ